MRPIPLCGCIWMSFLMFMAFHASVGDAVALPSHAIFASMELTWKTIRTSLELKSNSFQYFHSYQSNGIYYDFWQKAIELGSVVHNYTESLLQHVAALNPSAAEPLSDFKTTMHKTVTSATRFRDEVQSYLEAHQLTFDQVSEKLSAELAVILTELEADYPLPNNATHHEQRAQLVSHVLSKVEESLVGLLTPYGASEASVRARFKDVGLHVEKVLVLAGDVIEQHPILLEIVLFCGATLLLPEVQLLRPILSLFGFGPYGPIKGSSAAWAQRTFWGAAVAKGSWFARLQSVGMKFRMPGKTIAGFIGLAFALLSSLFRCR